MLVINGRFLTQKITGVQRAGIELVKELDKLSKPGEIEIATPPGIINEIELHRIKIVIIGRKSGQIWIQRDLYKYVKQRGAELLTISGLAPVLNPGYLVKHDITFARYPDSFGFRYRTVNRIMNRMILNRCRHIFTVSEFSKMEISSYYGIKTEKISVIYNSSAHFSNSIHKNSSIEKWEIKAGEYYLTVGSRNKHKNQEFIYKLALLNPDKVFVIVGQENTKSFSKVKISSIKNLIVTGHVNDEDLMTLYKNAKGFIFPSLYEGFGIPPLEAIALGVRSIAVSDIPVFREIYDRGVFYFDPMHPSMFSFERFDSASLSDSDIESYMRKYTWSNSAKVILDRINCDNE